MAQNPVDRLIGSRPQPWQVEHWINSQPLSLKGLKGRVVLVRWWTGPHCPFCSATAPSLNLFHRQYSEQGLTVIGFYHHKAAGQPEPSQVEAFARKLGFRFPLAIDQEWKTLSNWWLGGRRDFTSVSFLIDRQGIIRHIHPGGQYVPGDADFRVLKERIEELLLLSN